MPPRLPNMGRRRAAGLSSHEPCCGQRNSAQSQSKALRSIRNSKKPMSRHPTSSSGRGHFRLRPSSWRRRGPSQSCRLYIRTWKSRSKHSREIWQRASGRAGLNQSLLLFSPPLATFGGHGYDPTAAIGTAVRQRSCSTEETGLPLPRWAAERQRRRLCSWSKWQQGRRVTRTPSAFSKRSRRLLTNGSSCKWSVTQPSRQNRRPSRQSVRRSKQSARQSKKGRRPSRSATWRSQKSEQPSPTSKRHILRSKRRCWKCGQRLSSVNWPFKTSTGQRPRARRRWRHGRRRCGSAMPPSLIRWPSSRSTREFTQSLRPRNATPHSSRHVTPRGSAMPHCRKRERQAHSETRRYGTRG
mmetsp:Transcript_4554/g.12081  ORF Transcript_4554/g.12081 Transcript_4554/m.12081 type:complete len:355 (+) Transcript_4554:164-1228(+)